MNDNMSEMICVGFVYLFFVFKKYLNGILFENIC